MKRLISLLLVLVMVLTLTPAVRAYSSPKESSNAHDHFYINVGRWTDPIKSTLYAEDGGYVRVEYVEAGYSTDASLIVEHYDADLNFVSGMELAEELPVYGGVYIGDDYNFLVTGQNNVEEDDTKEVFRITRYNKDWEKIDSAGLYGANTVYPFDAGCVRFDRSGDILYIRTSHEMYTTEDGLNHQANVFIALRVSDMTITDSFTDILNRNYGYISHSFNQFVRVDGDTLLAVDHGDALPRSVVLIKYGAKAGEEEFFGRVTCVNALNIADSTYHYNDTGVSVGGFECSSSHYLIAGSSAPQTGGIDLMYAHRNIFVTATPKDDFTDEATTINWLTNYAESDKVNVSPPHLVKLDADRFILVWTEDHEVRYCFLDGEGQIVGEIQSDESDLSDCVPIVDGNRLLWYVTDYSAPVFYEIDISLPCEHTYSSVVTAPTCTERGYTTHTCTICGDSYVDAYTDALGHTFGSWQQTQAPGCESTGTEQRSCTVCGHTETRDVAASGHSYASVVTQPTCTERGYTTHTCTICGNSYVDAYTDALGHTEVTDVGYAATCTESGLSDGAHCAVCAAVLKEQTVIPATGHSWDEGVITKEPTVEQEGEVLYTCLSCGITRTEALPAHVHDYAGTEIVEPTCEAEGFTRHICSGCGHTYSDTFVPALGHEWYGLDCLRCGAVRENPFTDTDPLAFYFEPVLWAVERGITNGATATTFDPLGKCQRAQVVTFLWRAAGKPEPAGTTNPFVDVKETDFYYKAVLWAVEKGITNGLDATHFGPFAYCNRAQVVTFLWRSVDRPEAAATNPFTDVTEGAFYYDAVLWAVENGVTNGLSATEFGINTICNRAQIVTFLYRAFAE